MTTREINKRKKQIMDRKSQVAEWFKYHKDRFFKNTKVDNYNYVPKLVFSRKNSEPMMSFFQSELEFEYVFTEPEDRETGVNNKQRLLYRFAPDLLENVESFTTSTGSIRYEIPLSKMELVYDDANIIEPVKASSKKAVSNSAPYNSLEDMEQQLKENLEGKPKKRISKEDEAFSKMTIKDYFAIHHLKPVSDKPWLNQLIKDNE